MAPQLYLPLPFALVEESLPEAFIEHMKELTKWCASTKDFNIIHQPILLESRLKTPRGIKQVYSHNEVMSKVTNYMHWCTQNIKDAGLSARVITM